MLKGVIPTEVQLVSLSHQNRSPKIGPSGPILADKPAKVVTSFATKTGLARPILAAKVGPLFPKPVPHGRPILAKIYQAILVRYKVAILYSCACIV